MAKEKSTSIRYINWLRIIAIYTVVAAHIAIWTAEGQEPLSTGWWVGNWIHILAIWTVPVFVMVSGILLLGNPRNETAMQFYKKRMHRIGVPVIFWTAVYILARKYIGHESLSPGYVAHLVVTATPYYHLWYLLMIPGLYLVTPPLRYFVKKSSQNLRLVAIAIILLLAAVYYPINILYWGRDRTIFTVFFPFIGYYLCGYELRSIDLKKLLWPIVALVGLTLVYALLIRKPFVENLGYIGEIYIIDFFCPPVILMAVVIFVAACQIERRWVPQSNALAKAESWLASTTLGIYVLHPLVLEYMRMKMSRRAADEGLLIALIVGPVIAFGASYILTSLMMNVPFLRRTVS